LLKAKANENARRDSVPKSQSFSSSLDMANKDQTEHKLKDMLKNIEVAGKKLISTRSVEDAKEYKRKIQDYLSFIVKNIYVLKKEPGPFNYGVHVRIEVINKKLDELTKDIIQAQLETIEIADKIEEIRGLLIDAYK
jgi:uncharacterized protein YaaR (DUF327 family)